MSLYNRKVTLIPRRILDLSSESELQDSDLEVEPDPESSEKLKIPKEIEDTYLRPNNDPGIKVDYAVI